MYALTLAGIHGTPVAHHYLPGPVALPNGKVGVAESAWPGWLFRLGGWPGRNRGEMSNVNAVRAAQDQGQRDAQHRQDYYGARPGEGVPAGSTGEHENRR